MFQQTKLLCGASLLAQWSLLLWLNQRLELDPFTQLILVPLLMLLGLALLAFRPSAHCD